MTLGWPRQVVGGRRRDPASISDAEARAAVRGPVDAASVAAFSAAVAEAKKTAGDVVVDLRHADDISPAAVEVLVDETVRLSQAGYGLRIIGRPEIIRHLLNLGLGDLLKTDRVTRRHRLVAGS